MLLKYEKKNIRCVWKKCTDRTASAQTCLQNSDFSILNTKTGDFGVQNALNSGKPVNACEGKDIDANRRITTREIAERLICRIQLFMIA